MDIRTSCLGVLTLGDASGYEIRKSFEDGPFSHFAEGGFGSIYPALNKMEIEGLVTARMQEQEKRPAKKVYSITPKGRLTFLDSLAKAPREDKFKSDFLFAMFFADYLSPSEVEKLIDTRVKELTEKVERMEQCHTPHEHEQNQPTQGALFVHGFGLALYRAALSYLESEKHKAIAAALQGSDGDNGPGDGTKDDNSQAAE